MSSLTAEQRTKIEANRQKALQRRKLAQLRQNQPENSPPVSSNIVNTNNRPVSCHSRVPPLPQTLQTVGNTRSQPSSATGNTQPPGGKNGSLAPGVFYGRRVTVRFSLLDESRFVAECDYSPPVVERFRCIASRRYDSEQRTWSFAVTDHATLLRLLGNLPAGQLTVQPLPAFVLRALSEPPPPHAHSIDLSPVEAPLRDVLMPFQREGVQMCIARGGRALLADDMGLGKTLQALAVVSYYGEWPLLVLCPSSVRYHWQQTVVQHLTSLPPDSVHVLQSARETGSVCGGGACSVLIVSYDLLSHGDCARQLAPPSGGSVRFPSVIADESHCLKNFRSARTRCSQPLLLAAHRCLLLSGTPALSRPAELFTQITAVTGQRGRRLFPGFPEFAARYCVDANSSGSSSSGGGGSAGWIDCKGACNLQELHTLLSRRLMVRRLKRDILSQLPDKQRSMVMIGRADRADLCSAMTQLHQRLTGWGASGGGSKRRDGALLEYFRESANVKLTAVCQYVDNLLNTLPTEKQFICFAHHRQMLDAICALLDRRDVRHVRIDGTTDASLRQRHCVSFQQGGEGSVRVAVLSLTAAGAGITLTAASLLLFAELFWNPGVLSQAEDRAHRIGQQHTVQVQYLVMQNTADDHIWPLVQRKLNILNQVGLGGGKDFSTVEQKCDLPSGKSTQPVITDWFEQLEEECIDEDSLQKLEESGKNTKRKRKRAHSPCEDSDSVSDYLD